MFILIFLLILMALGGAIATEGIGKSKKLIILGISLFCIGVIILVLGLIPKSDYTDWQQTSENIIALKFKDSYYIEKNNEYIFKSLKYSLSGEKIVQYREIQKESDFNKNRTLIKVIEIDETDTATVAKFERKKKTLFNSLGAIFDIHNEEMYVFFIPKS